MAQVETMTGRFLRVHQHYCDILGYTREEMTRLTLQEITHPGDLHENLDHLERLQVGLIRDFSIEKRYIRKDGSVVWANLTVSPMWEAGETPTYHIAVVEDITRRKQTETDLLKFSRAVEQSISSVLITDANGRIEFVNPTFTRLSGYSMDEVLGKNPSISKSGQTSAQEYEKMWQIITSGKDWKGELRNRRKDGQLYWVSASISPIRDAAGAITHFLAIQEDITERKRLEQQLFRQNNYLSALHEISLGILGHLDVNELLQDLVTRACQVLQAQNGCIYLVNKSLDQLECMFGVGILKNYVGICFKPGEGIAGKVWATARPLIIEDYPSWEGRSSQIGSKDVRSVIGIPLVSEAQAIGVLVLVYGLDSGRVFSADEVALLERLANLAQLMPILKQEGFDLPRESLRVDGFFKIAVAAGFQAALAVIRHSQSGKGKDGHLPDPGISADTANSFISIHTRHLNIHKYNINFTPFVFKCFYSLFAVFNPNNRNFCSRFLKHNNKMM